VQPGENSRNDDLQEWTTTAERRPSQQQSFCPPDKFLGQGQRRSDSLSEDS